MITVETIKAWKKIRNNIQDTIGFVPTMGALHEGHMSLIKRSLEENKKTVVSIFVNPLQFNDPNDLEKYPKTIEADKAILAKLKVDYLFYPSVEEMYPNKEPILINTNHAIANLFEGIARPGHFNGMLTVVLKLLNIIEPRNIYFGEKDYQQYLLVKHMVESLFLEVNVIPCETIREPSGLPLSSRNRLLGDSDKRLAEEAYHYINKVTPDNIVEIKQQLTQIGVQVEYIDAYDDRIYLAMKMGDVRLIDNFVKLLKN